MQREADCVCLSHKKSPSDFPVYTQHALRILRAHGLSDSELHAVFRSVTVAKIMYASSDSSAFANKRHEQRIDAFLGRNNKRRFCQPGRPSFHELCDTNNEQLCGKILCNPQHLFCISYFLHEPSAASQSYNLRSRRHRQLLP